MRIYYLFVIKKEFYLVYKKKSYVLYKILENLYNLKTYDFSYGLNIYNQLCLPFAKKILNNYIKEKIKYHQINKREIKIASNYENTYVEIKYPCVIIKTNTNFPQIFKMFNIYSKTILVCDFKNQDYFWLKDQIKTTFKR